MLGLLDGLELIEAGLVWLPQWRPDADTTWRNTPEKVSMYGAVARKRQPPGRPARAPGQGVHGQRRDLHAVAALAAGVRDVTPR